jgi:hypothetical protein
MTSLEAHDVHDVHDVQDNIRCCLVSFLSLTEKDPA